MNIESEPNYFGLPEVPTRVQKLIGKRSSLSAAYRWVDRGIAGVRLRTIYALGAQRTSDEWLLEFFTAVANAKASKRQSAVDAEMATA